ncbi:MAG: 50S ribosomal protein L25/general stress protein Ctc [Rikenellaceae bacterium]|nr:50S ribosomal protein L25/general stress protein Ctc [Rikenellaceae bacterium]
MKTFEIKGRKRDGFGKKETKKVRSEGQVPCVIYGEGDTIHFSVDAKELNQLIYTPNSYIIEFDIDGQKTKAVMREVQYHPVKDYVLHIDFFRVVPGKKVAIDIPVKLYGNSEGVKMGGKLMLSKRNLRVLAKEEDLPDTLDIDISGLGLGKSVFVSDLSFENMDILTPATTAICAVKMTRAARGAAAAAAANEKKK